MAGKNSEKDRMMAADLKARGVTRTIMKCPMCGHTISIEGQIGHLNQCGRGSNRDEQKSNDSRGK